MWCSRYHSTGSRLRHEVVDVVVGVVIDQVADQEPAKIVKAAGVPKITTKAPRKIAASGSPTAGGMTSPIRRWMVVVDAVNDEVELVYRP